MNVRPDAPQLNACAHLVAAALATIITVAILGSVTELLLHNGRPLERSAAAERACATHRYVSEREACMREWTPAQRSLQLAEK